MTVDPNLALHSAITFGSKANRASDVSKPDVAAVDGGQLLRGNPHWFDKPVMLAQFQLGFASLTAWQQRFK
jgi:hypothetical protein